MSEHSGQTILPAARVVAQAGKAPRRPILPSGVWRVRCGGDTAAAGEAARAVLDARVASEGHAFSLALSGGRIAPVLYTQLVQQSRLRGVDLADVDFFWADERCVPPDHEESNFRVAQEQLLGPLQASYLRVHRLEGELKPAEAATRASAAWRAWSEAAGGGASFGASCIVLGVGEDGHVASLFPGNLNADLEEHAPFAAVVGPKPPPQRLTMSYPMLWQATWVVVLATGEGKDRVVDAALSRDLALPLARVLAGRTDRPTQIFTR